MTDYKLELYRDKVFFGDLAFGDMFMDDVENIFVKTLCTKLIEGGEFNAVRIADFPFCYYFKENESVVRIKKAVFTV